MATPDDSKTRIELGGFGALMGAAIAIGVPFLTLQFGQLLADEVKAAIIIVAVLAGAAVGVTALALGLAPRRGRMAEAPTADGTTSPTTTA